MAMKFHGNVRGKVRVNFLALFQGRTNPAFLDPFRRLRGSEERSPCFQGRMQIRHLHRFRQNGPFWQETKTRFTKDTVCATPTLCLETAHSHVWCPQTVPNCSCECSFELSPFPVSFCSLMEVPDILLPVVGDQPRLAFLQKHHGRFMRGWAPLHTLCSRILASLMPARVCFVPCDQTCLLGVNSWSLFVKRDSVK